MQLRVYTHDRADYACEFNCLHLQKQLFNGTYRKMFSEIKSCRFIVYFQTKENKNNGGTEKLTLSIQLA